MLDQQAHGKFTPLGRPLDTEKLILQLQNAVAASDSLRIHIPRALRVVYDIRNKRDAAHLADGIDPNLQDATLVISILDWVLAEFVRMHHGASASEAQRIVDGLVVRKVPAVEDFDGFLKVLNPKLKVSEYVLLVLYERGKSGALYGEIEGWVHPDMRRNLRRTLEQMVHDKAYVHSHGDKYILTKSGIGEVEKRNLHQVI